MNAVRARLRADLRARWASWVAFALAIGAVGAVVLTAAAGARRTDTAYERFLAVSRAEDVYIAGDRYSPEATAFFDELEHLPQVVSGGGVAAMIVVPPSGSLASPYHFAGLDRRYGHTIDRPKIIRGRLPRIDRADEVLVNQAMARVHHLRVGSTVDWTTFTTAQSEDPEFKGDLSVGMPVHLRVVGVGVYPNEVVPTAQYDSLPFFYLSPAYYEAHPSTNQGYGFEVIRLAHGKADVAGFQAGMTALSAKHGLDPHQFLFTDRTERNGQVERAIRPQAVALAVFALLAAVASLVVLGGMSAQQAHRDSADYPTLHALGMTRRQLFAMSMVKGLSVAVTGAVIAVLGAVLASPLMPVGPARLAEPHPGVAFNASLLGTGAAAIVILFAAAFALPAWRAGGIVALGHDASGRDGQKRGRLVEAMASAGLPPAPAMGLRAALQSGTGRAGVPVGSALVTSGLAIATLAATFTFSANLDRLANTPRLYGWNWDIKAGDGFFAANTAEVMDKLAADPDVEAVAGGTFGGMEIAGRPVPVFGLDGLRGSPFPTLLEGRQPRSDDEIVLGTRTLKRAHQRVGGTVAAGFDGPPVQMHIVGRAIFPKIGAGSFSPTNLGEGAVTRAQRFVDPEAPAGDKYGFLLVRLRAGANLAANRIRLSRSLAGMAFCGGDPNCAKTAERPGDISNYARVRRTPLVLAGVLAIVAAGALGHALITSVHRRRRDLAVLKALGLSRRQVSATTSWQATASVVTALLIGLPLGTAFGRVVWRAFANQLGVEPNPSTPVSVLLLATLVAVVIANVVAAVPAAIAARTHPAVVLRSE